MNDLRVIGIKPWLPPPLSYWSWWTEPVPASRLAALRVGVGMVLLADVLGSYLPRSRDFFGPGSLTASGTFAEQGASLDWHRVALDQIQILEIWYIVLLVWASSAALLTLGLAPRVAAAVAWFISISLTRINPAMHNSGDQVRNIVLFYLLLSPCGAAWSVMANRSVRSEGKVRIHPWPLRLLVVQLSLIYFANGLHKMLGQQWLSGSTLTIILGDSAWTRWNFSNWPMPGWLLHGMTWIVLLWEVAFPFCLFVPKMRILALCMGVAFHVVTGVTMRLGLFPLYMLCLYLPLVPWERWGNHSCTKPV